MVSIFISHSRRDNDVLSMFTNIFSTTSVKAHLVEYENITSPASIDIEKKIEESEALFIILGPNILNYDQTKICVSWESAIAHTKGKPVWVFEQFDYQIAD